MLPSLSHTCPRPQRKGTRAKAAHRGQRQSAWAVYRARISAISHKRTWNLHGLIHILKRPLYGYTSKCQLTPSDPVHTGVKMVSVYESFIRIDPTAPVVPTPPWVGYGYVECTHADSTTARRRARRGGSEHLPEPPSIGPVTRVCDGIDDCVRGVLCDEPLRDMSSMIFTNIPADTAADDVY